MENRNLYDNLKEYASSQGADLFGVADISAIKDEFSLSEEIKGKVSRAVSLGMRINPLILSEIEGHPTKLYFHHYKTVNVFLDQLALKVSNYII